jgi:hypothetical protein
MTHEANPTHPCTPYTIVCNRASLHKNASDSWEI